MHKSNPHSIPSATGTKLAKRPSSDRARGQRTDYAGNFVYKDSELAYILTDQGRIVPRNGSFEYQYFIKDHLGNTRVAFNDDGEILQDNSYYTFKMLERSGNPATAGRMDGLDYSASGLDPDNKHLYNSKELQDDFDLDWYDYGARMYDAQLGRWHVGDPKAEDYLSSSPYHLSGNNPMKFVDTDGKDFDWYQSKTNDALIWLDKKKEEVKIDGEEFENIGESISVKIGDKYFNCYQNVIVAESNIPINATELVLSDPGLRGTLLGKNSPLSQQSKMSLHQSTIHSYTHKAAGYIIEGGMLVAPLPKVGVGAKLLSRAGKFTGKSIGRASKWIGKKSLSSYVRLGTKGNRVINETKDRLIKGIAKINNGNIPNSLKKLNDHYIDAFFRPGSKASKVEALREIWKELEPLDTN